MVLLVKFLLILVFGMVFLQDFKERLVSVYLYFLIAFLGILLYYLESTDYTVMLFEIALNFLLVSLVLGIAFLVSKLIFKRKFINYSMGIGDIVMFFTLCFLFPSIPFVLFFVFSLFFSLLVHLFVEKKNKTVPLAGYMGLFYAFVLLFSVFTKLNPYRF